MASDSLISSLLTSQQLSSAVSPMTILYSTTSALSSILGVDTSSSPTEAWTARSLLEHLYRNPYKDHTVLGDFGMTVIPTDRAWYALQDKCSDLWYTSLLDWLATQVGNGIITYTAPVTCETLTSGSSKCYTIKSMGTRSSFPWRASPPCCGDFCTFTAGDVQVYQWPMATDTPSITRLVNSEGFTL